MSSNSFNIITAGYGGRCTIGGSTVLMTGYTLTKSINWIKAQGATGGYFDGAKFLKIQDGVVIDHAVQELKVDFELIKGVLATIINHIKNNVNKSGSLAVTVEELNYGWSLEFDTPKLTAFSFDISEGSFAKGSATFLIVNNEIEVEGMSYSGGGGGSPPGNTNLWPYWNTTVSVGDIGDCVDFSFDWSQSYDLKYTLKGGGGETPLPPYKILWHVPTYRFSATGFYGNESTPGDDFKGPTSVSVDGVGSFNFDEAYVESTTQTLGDGHSYHTYNISGFGTGQFT